MLLAVRPFAGKIRANTNGVFSPCEASAMTMNRRDALTAVVGGLMCTAAAGADDKPAAKVEDKFPTLPRDTLLAALPPAALKVVEFWFPNYWCVRLVTHHQANPKWYRATLFTPRGPRRTNWTEGNEIAVPPMYEVSVTEEGKVLEESSHAIERDLVPMAVIAAYEKWNPTAVKGMVTTWATEVAAGKERVFRVAIVVSQVKFYAASFQADGTVIKADPIDAR
jgi:hypothetical protein